MSELTSIIVGLQRLGDAVQIRGDDLRYMQQQQVYDHVGWIDQQLDMVDKVRSVLLEERKRFMPIEEPRQVTDKDAQKISAAKQQDAVPKFLKQGPVKEPV